MAKLGTKALTPDQLPPYECKKHGPVKPKLQLRPSGYWHRRCSVCFKDLTRPYMRKYMRGWNKRQRSSARFEVLTEYGGKCVCPGCPESNFGFLTIDHEYDDGKQHRTQLGGAGGIYFWIKKHGMPRDRGLRIMCFNCNMGRARNGGTCPHLDPPMGAAPDSGSG